MHCGGAILLSRRASAAALILLVAVAGQARGGAATDGRPQPAASPTAPLPRAEARHRGVSWVGGQEITQKDLEPLTSRHVSWIVQTPFGWQRAHDSPEIRMATEGRVWWGERDVGLVTTARMARALGVKTLLKPHIWLSRSAGGKWSGQIEMATEEDWLKWFASYRTFILHYARLAQDNDMDALCVGTELQLTVKDRRADWRKLIAEVRGIYKGPLVYAANWHQEFDAIEFWDDLDYIGIQAYFPLTDKKDPTVAELKEGWRRHLPAIEKVQRRFGKPILFTEVGYRSSADAAIEPWAWPERGSTIADEAGLRTQANAYQAFFETFWDKEWVIGAYIWKWYPGIAAGGRALPGDFSPQNKPAEQTMAQWFGGLAP